MGQCVTSIFAEKRKVLQRVRGIRAREDHSLGNARLVGHLDLWDEYERTDEVLGSGLNGQVVRIVSRRREECLEFALKEIRKEGKLNEELMVCLDLDHVNIVRLFEIYESDTSLFLVVELCRGGDLFARLKGGARFNEVEATYIIAQILRAVNYMHSLDIVHGDLKLENFLLSNGGNVFKQTVKLIDFGFSHRGTGTVKGGSLQYMAPEKFIEGKETPKSDIWSVGVIAFMLLTGKALFSQETMKRRDGIFFPDKNINEKLEFLSPDAIDFVSNCCLRVDPLQRASAREALAHRWLRGMTVKRMSSKLSIVSETQRVLSLLVQFSQLGALKRASLGLIALVCPPPSLVPTAPAVFDLIDTNCDGFIQECELMEIFKAHDMEISPNFFASLDLSGDHRINYSEFLAATEVLSNVLNTENNIISPIYISIIKSVFRKLDRDNSGYISRQNLRDLFGTKGFQGSSNSKMLKEGDFTGDGHISESEFFSLIISC